MIPCKENKCILFPACKNKIVVYCNPLLKYMKSQYKDLDNDNSYLITPVMRGISNVNIEIWKSLNKNLPKLRGIFPERYPSKAELFMKETN